MSGFPYPASDGIENIKMAEYPVNLIYLNNILFYWILGDVGTRSALVNLFSWTELLASYPYLWQGGFSVLLNFWRDILIKGRGAFQLD